MEGKYCLFVSISRNTSKNVQNFIFKSSFFNQVDGLWGGMGGRGEAGVKRILSGRGLPRKKNCSSVKDLESVSVPTVAREMQDLCSCTPRNVRRRGGWVASVLPCGPTLRGIEAWSGAEVRKARRNYLTNAICLQPSTIGCRI